MLSRAGWAVMVAKTQVAILVEVVSFRYTSIYVTEVYKRNVRRHNWCPTSAQALRKEQHESNMVHAWPLPRNIP